MGSQPVSPTSSPSLAGTPWQRASPLPARIWTASPKPSTTENRSRPYGLKKNVGKRSAADIVSTSAAELSLRYSTPTAVDTGPAQSETGSPRSVAAATSSLSLTSVDVVPST